MTSRESCAPTSLRIDRSLLKTAVPLVAILLFAACSGEDEATRLQRELSEAQTAMAFCDQAPANCNVEELAKRNAALSSAELNMNKFQTRD